MLEAAMYHHKDGNIEDAEELTNDALENIYEAIHQIQAAREDAARMAGLLDLLALKEGN